MTEIPIDLKALEAALCIERPLEKHSELKVFVEVGGDRDHVALVCLADRQQGILIYNRLSDLEKGRKPTVIAGEATT